MVHAESVRSKRIRCPFNIDSLSRPGVAILLAGDLTATEKLALVGLVQIDDGNGSQPSNADLARVCRFKADDFNAVVNAMLRRLDRKGWIHVQAVPRTDANPTGRVIHLTPKAMGGDGGR